MIFIQKLAEKQEHKNCRNLCQSEQSAVERYKKSVG
jgi:hypothetical protein